jgi:nitrate reductase molybdenum cofactor assembly chaperone
MKLSHYTLLADFFDYPNVTYVEKAKITLAHLKKNYPQTTEMLTLFSHEIEKMALRDLQELYTRSFDVQAATTLDVGYVLFGDDYKRGETLVNLNREHKTVNNPCGSELSDHLPTVLRLLPMLKDPAFTDELVREMVGPALVKMISDFDPMKLEKKEVLFKKHYKTVIEVEREKAVMFGQPLKALYEVLKSDFSLVEKTEPKQTSDFLKFVTEENEIEQSE